MLMRFSFLLIILYITISAKAQPVLISSEMAPFGSNWTLTYTQSFSVMDTTIQGANATWNFSGMQPSSNSFTINIVDPALTPYAASFPNSNYAYHESPSVAYRYFHLNSNKMERVGSWTSTGGLRTYSDPQIEYVFPLTLGTYNHDTWHNSASSTGGIYELNCIGYGNLILPSGTYNDALMVRVYVEESFLSFYAYFWYSSSSGIVLVQYIAGDGFFIPQSLSYASSISLATNINSKDIFTNFHYTNPVTSDLSILFNKKTNEKIDYEVSNSIGQKILYGSIENNEGSLHIQMDKLDSGLYFVTFRENQKSAAKTIKVVKL
jgi:hypothetical protein